MLVIGDVVQLKSGGPTMTVRAAGNPELIRVDWIDDEGKVQWNYFDERQLMLAKTKRKG